MKVGDSGIAPSEEQVGVKGIVLSPNPPSTDDEIQY